MKSSKKSQDPMELLHQISKQIMHEDHLRYYDSFYNYANPPPKKSPVVCPPYPEDMHPWTRVTLFKSVTPLKACELPYKYFFFEAPKAEARKLLWELFKVPMVEAPTCPCGCGAWFAISSGPDLMVLVKYLYTVDSTSVEEFLDRPHVYLHFSNT